MRLADWAPNLQVSVTCDQPGPTTYSPLPLWTLDFGRPLQQANPLALFRVAGVYRYVAPAGSYSGGMGKVLMGREGVCCRCQRRLHSAACSLQ